MNLFFVVGCIALVMGTIAGIAVGIDWVTGYCSILHTSHLQQILDRIQEVDARIFALNSKDSYRSAPPMVFSWEQFLELPEEFG